ncbi:MAG TPA: restriction endonuclease subunit S [Vicinamibacterales bacterium]|nr:restriction endonuclease subunit S [Vicinamibacterales bacterium]
MIDSLKPYPAMKDSGVPWLGDLPTHWAIKPGRACFREKRVPNVGLSEATVLSLSYGRIVVKPADRLHGLVPASFQTYQIVVPGDIVVRPTDLQNDWNSLRFALSRERGIITSAYLCFQTTSDLTREYGYWLLHTYDLMKVFYGLGSGLRQSLDWGDFKYLACLVPPLREQAAIACFLGHADRRIRRYIRAKQKLIRLLEEQKRTIVTHAVTRGLDPTAHLKSSGVAWLGDIPAHWNLIRFKYLASRIVDCLHATPVYSADGQYPAIRTADISPGTIRLNGARRVNEDVYREWVQRLEPAAGDILYSREGERFGIAACVPPHVHLCISQRMMIFRIRDQHDPRFIMWLLNSSSVVAQANQDLMGATAPHVNVSTIRNFTLAVPSHSEQTAIADYISRNTSGCVETIESVRRELDLIREYRTRLIADVVTGKLDVREAAAHLPEEAEEPEELDEGSETASDEADEEAQAVAEEAGT